jgi:hypothetical protein
MARTGAEIHVSVAIALARASVSVPPMKLVSVTEPSTRVALYVPMAMLPTLVVAVLILKMVMAELLPLPLMKQKDWAPLSLNVVNALKAKRYSFAAVDAVG